MKLSAHLLILLSITFSSCFAQIKGEGDIVDRTLKTESFSGVKLKGSFNVVVSQGEQNVKATGHGNIIDRLKTEVENDVLILELKKGSYRDYKLTVYVTATQFSKIALDGSGDIWINKLTGKDLSISMAGSGDIVTKEKLDMNGKVEVNLAGSGDINLNLVADEVNTSVAGSGDIRLSGETDVLEISVAGSGDFHGQDLKSSTCIASIAGSGDAKLNVSGSLKARVSGSGDIRYKGQPDLDSKVAGSGSVKAM